MDSGATSPRPERSVVISHMMMSDCGGVGMMVMGWLGALLGLSLVGSLIVLTWVAIGRLRRQSVAPQGSR